MPPTAHDEWVAAGRPRRWLWVSIGVILIAATFALLAWAVAQVYWPLLPTLGLGILLVWLIDRARGGRRG